MSEWSKNKAQPPKYIDIHIKISIYKVKSSIKV